MIDPENMMLFIYQVLGTPFVWAAAFVGAFFIVLMMFFFLIDLLDP